MNHNEIEKSIAKAVNQAPTLNFENLATIPIVKMTEHDYITRQPVIQKASRFRKFSAAFVSCLALLLCFSGWYVQYKVPFYTISIDVNPSIQIITNRHNQILSVRAINQDAQDIVNDLNVTSSDINRVVNDIVTLLINQNYLNNDKNIVLVSVENKNLKDADKIAVSLDQVIQESALSKNVKPQVLRQVFNKDKEASALAKQYHLSVGKLKLIQEIVTANETLSIEQLSSMSMEELMTISKENGVNLKKTIQFDDNDSNQLEPKNSNTTDKGRNNSNLSEQNKSKNAENDNHHSESSNHDKDKKKTSSSKAHKEDKEDKDDSSSKKDKNEENNTSSKTHKADKDSTSSATPNSRNDSSKNNKKEDDTDSSNSQTFIDVQKKN